MGHGARAFAVAARAKPHTGDGRHRGGACELCAAHALDRRASGEFLEEPLERDDFKLKHTGPLLPRPALRGERVGVRGYFHELGAWRVPLTRSLRLRPLPVAGRGDRVILL